MVKWFNFTGIDGSGKTTVLQEVARSLRVPLTTFREPHDYYRGLLFSENQLPQKNTMETQMLFAAARCRSNAEIYRSLEAGYVVLSDRGTDCTVAYGMAEGLPLETLQALNHITNDKFWPRKTFWLDVDLATAASRVTHENHYDSASDTMRRAIVHGYRMQADSNPTRIIRVDANQALADVVAFVVPIIERYVIDGEQTTDAATSNG